MQERVKRILKVVSMILLAVLTLVSIYELVKKAQQKNVLPIFGAIRRLSETGGEIVDVNGDGAHYLVYDNDESRRNFKSFLEELGYSFIGQYGKSDLYDFGAGEVLVKRTKIFNKYMLYDVYSDDFFE